MLKGDLATSPLPEVLRQLAAGGATGCLHVVDPSREPDADEAQVYLRSGRVYAVVVPGARPTLGARLVTSGALGPEALAEALEAQRTELQGWRLGELLVHLGYVDQPVVEDFVNEQVRASLSDLLPWRHATWKFRVNQKTREAVAPPVSVSAPACASSLEMPKSSTFGMQRLESSGSCARKTLSGLMARWMTPCRCAAATARMAGNSQSRHVEMARGPAAIACRSVFPSKSSMTKKPASPSAPMS